MKNIHFEVGYEIKYAELSLNSISVYRELLQDKVILSLRNFLKLICQGKVYIESVTNLYNELVTDSI